MSTATTVHRIDSAEHMQQVARTDYMPIRVRTAPDFSSRLIRRELADSAALTAADSGRLWTARMPQRFETAQDELLMFCIHTTGGGELSQHGRTVALGSGVGVLYEARSAWEMSFPDRIRSLTFQFPRGLISMRARDITASCARPVDIASPGTRLATDFLSRLFQVADLSGFQQHDARQAAIELVVMMLRGLTPTPPTGTGADAVLLQAVQSYVRGRLHDPELTVDRIARRHHMSVRRLYTIFEGSGTTPSAYLRQQRLLAAETMLTDPRQADRSITDIAAAVGLTEVRTFERMFRRVHGSPPATWRRRSGRG